MRGCHTRWMSDRGGGEFGFVEMGQLVSVPGSRLPFPSLSASQSTGVKAKLVCQLVLANLQRPSQLDDTLAKPFVLA